ncbi:MAG: aspartate-semialdehyde dehydrogenase, partial [Bacteroidetes bacterium]|nr:aspartate-semialdehyde dehydrogenase [Bacteroidota bacterium]
KVLVSTYQAASGAGTAGMHELEEQTRSWLATGQAKSGVFGHPLPFNLVPHIDAFQGNGYTREEMKVCWETRKIMGMPDLPVSCTAVRVPVMRAHAESVVIETVQPITVSAVREVLSRAPGICLVDDPASRTYPMPITASGRKEVEVGRLRRSLVFGEYGLEFFLCGDQLLKGAALNAVQIIDCLVGKQRVGHKTFRKSPVLS